MKGESGGDLGKDGWVWAKRWIWAKIGGEIWAKMEGGLGKDGPSLPPSGRPPPGGGSGQRWMGVWAKIDEGLSKDGGGLSKDGGGLSKDWVASAGPCTSSGGDCKASGVARETWRTWLGWRRWVGMGVGASWAAAAAAGRWGGVGEGEGRPGRAGRTGGGGGGGGSCRWDGNVGNVSEKQKFGSKERARRGFVAKKGRVWAKMGGEGSGQRMHFVVAKS